MLDNRLGYSLLLNLIHPPISVRFGCDVVTYYELDALQWFEYSKTIHFSRFSNYYHDMTNQKFIFRSPRYFLSSTGGEDKQMRGYNFGTRDYYILQIRIRRTKGYKKLIFNFR